MKTILQRHTVMKHAFLFLILMFATAVSWADEVQLKNFSKSSNESLPVGLFFSFPCLYTTYSAEGLQIGYQFPGHINVRLELSMVNSGQGSNDAWFAIPSLGVFYSRIGLAPMLFYDGFTLGVENGMMSSFSNPVLFANAVSGIELYASRSMAFFLEIGSGFAYPATNGFYLGGTVIKGGGRLYLF